MRVCLCVHLNGGLHGWACEHVEDMRHLGVRIEKTGVSWRVALGSFPQGVQPRRKVPQARG